jgi:acetylglutamate kinase
MDNDAQRKAAVLAEALPWLKEFRGATVVVKFGGNAMGDAALLQAFAEDIVFMRLAGLQPIVVHGGGPQISAMLDELGITSEFTGGLRVTTRETMDVVRMVLTGQVQREIVAAINAHGPFAVGLSGEDAHVFIAEKTHAVVDGAPVDIGFVGDVVDVNAEFLHTLLASELIPVVSTVGTGVDGESYNVNADTAAAALAVAIGARKLVMLTDVEGVYRNWPESTEVISSLTASDVREMLPTLAAGMIPKLQGCLRAVEAGVEQAHVIDGRLEHSVLLEVFTDTGVGTMVVP